MQANDGGACDAACYVARLLWLGFQNQARSMQEAS